MNASRMWRTPYRKRYQRLIRHIDEVAAQYRPAADADKETVRAAVNAYAAEIAEIADPLYIDEPGGIFTCLAFSLRRRVDLRCEYSGN